MLVRHGTGTHWRRPRPAALALSIVLIALFSSCNDPQAPVPGELGDIRADYRNGKLEFSVTSGSGAATSLTLVATELVYENSTDELHAQVALRNDGSEPVPGPESILVFGFVPETVVPLDAQCAPADSVHPEPACAFDYRGTYGEDDALSPGESSTPVGWTLLDPGGESFAFRARIGPQGPGPGTIAGVVFDDRTSDGRRQRGEPGIPGIAVTLRFGTEVQSASTDSRGRYLFHVDEPGIYALGLQPGPGWRPTSALPLEVAILRRPDGTLAAFLLGDLGLARQDAPRLVLVEGMVFEDLNRDGLYQPGEPGIAGVEIEGETECGERERTASSDSTGHYVLRLSECSCPWIVRSSSLDGWDRTTPKRVTFLVPPPAGEVLRADFGYAHEDRSSHLEVQGRVFLDEDRDGVRDPDEPGIPGVGVRAEGTTCDALSTAFAYTDARGRYELDGKDVGCVLPWIVERAALPGIEGTTPASVRLDAPPPGDDETFTVDFGIAPASTPEPLPAYTIEGTVFLDRDRSGTRQPDEPGIAAVQVVLLGPCRVLRAAVTDPNGNYRFEATEVERCAVTAVWQSLPEFEKRTTPNPVRVDPAAAPPGGTLALDFGVRGDHD